MRYKHRLSIQDYSTNGLRRVPGVTCPDEDCLRRLIVSSSKLPSIVCADEVAVVDERLMIPTSMTIAINNPMLTIKKKIIVWNRLINVAITFPITVMSRDAFIIVRRLLW